ncbi:hypothetical protein Tco_1459311 [Tanacetum coccineum]
MIPMTLRLVFPLWRGVTLNGFGYETLDPNCLFTNEVCPFLKTIEIVIRENVLCFNDPKDHISVNGAYILYCIISGTSYNLAHFITNRMIYSKNNLIDVLPYGLLLSKFFEVIKSTRSHFNDERFISYLPTLDPLTNPNDGDIVEDFRCSMHHHHDHDQTLWQKPFM